jgi:hypothetical protein
MDNLGDQPTDDVHRGILGEQRQMRPVVEDNASRRASGVEVLSCPAELRARLRSLRQTGHLQTGPRDAALCQLLAQAEMDPTALEPAIRVLDALTATDRRQILASYAALTRAA